MNYEAKARPITTAEELEAAIAAGAELEYTAYGPTSIDPDTYDMPRWFEPDSGGWVHVGAGFARICLAEGIDSDGFRAFYPLSESEAA